LTSETGGPIFISGLLSHFRQMLARAGLPLIRFHDLRHTAATLMLADGVPLVTVWEILGHSSPAIRANLYAHALDESKSVAIAGLSQQLKKGDKREPGRAAAAPRSIAPIAPVVAPVASWGNKNSALTGMVRALLTALLCGVSGGEGEIRTLEGVAPLAV